MASSVASSAALRLALKVSEVSVAAAETEVSKAAAVKDGKMDVTEVT